MRLEMLAICASVLCLAPLGACCWTSPASTAEWLAIGKRSPEQTLRSFQTGMKADSATLEYETLSETFKERENISQFEYSIARERLLAAKPWIRKLADAEIVASTRLSEDLHELVAELDTLFGTWRMRVLLEAESYYEIYAEERLLESEFADPESLIGFQLRDQTTYVYGQVALGPETDRDSITELRFGTEWKIAAIDLLEDDDPPQP